LNIPLISIPFISTVKDPPQVPSGAQWEGCHYHISFPKAAVSMNDIKCMALNYWQ